jgi:hypothetical protein
MMDELQVENYLHQAMVHIRHKKGMIRIFCLCKLKRRDNFLRALIGAYSGRSLELTDGIPLRYQTHQLVKPGGHNIHYR